MTTTSCKSSFLFVGCAAVLMLVATSAGATTVKVFLLGGQSNMVGMGNPTGLPVELQSPQEDVLFYYRYKGIVTPLTTLRPGSGGADANGFGPEVTFGRTIADAFPDEQFALIKHAANGSTLYSSWDPTPEGIAQGTTYVGFQNTVSDGLAALVAAGYTPEIVGMLWTQGETDANNTDMTVPGKDYAVQYEANLIEFIADIRSRYGVNLPFFLNRLSPIQTQIDPGPMAALRASQENVAAADPYTYMIDLDDFTSQQRGDAVHFNASGQMILGERFGEAYIGSVPEPSTLALAALGGLAMLRRRR